MTTGQPATSPIRSTARTRLLSVAAVALLCAPLAACSAVSGGESSIPGMPQRSSEYEASGAQSQEGMTTLPDSAGGEAPGSSPLVTPQTERSVISSGGLTIEVADPDESTADVADIAKRLGGYVESQSSNSYGESSSASVTIRVPSDSFDDAFDQLGELGNVRSDDRSATDVTAQHVDLQARVESLQTSVQRLQDLIAGAETTSELIEAESALTARQAELDGLTAQLEALEGQIDESTIWVTLTTPATIGGSGGPATFWDGLLAGLSSLWVAASAGLVILGVLLPWLVIAAIIAFVIVLIVRSSRKRRARRAAAQPTPAPFVPQAADAPVGQPAPNTAAPQITQPAAPETAQPEAQPLDQAAQSMPQAPTQDES